MAGCTGRSTPFHGVIEIEGMQFYAFHGVMPQEREVGNTYEVSVRLEYDMSAAALSDDIALALNYAEVVDVVGAVMSRPVNLLECLVENIRRELSARFPAITGGCIKVSKLNPPIPGIIDRVSLSTEWQSAK